MVTWTEDAIAAAKRHGGYAKARQKLADARNFYIAQHHALPELNGIIRELDRLHEAGEVE